MKQKILLVAILSILMIQSGPAAAELSSKPLTIDNTYFQPIRLNIEGSTITDIGLRDKTSIAWDRVMKACSYQTPCHGHIQLQDDQDHKTVAQFTIYNLDDDEKIDARAMPYNYTTEPFANTLDTRQISVGCQWKTLIG